MPSTPAEPSALVQRRQRQVQQRIVAAASDLFAARGFDAVSVTDIAARADVGRTTFFRYFGDKSEVVFAREQEMLEAIVDAAEQQRPTESPRSVREAVEQLAPIVLDLCGRATADPEDYARHVRLLEEHLELRARDALKLQQVADRLTEVLVGRGADAGVAVLAAQVALACYQTARRRAQAPGDLVGQTRAAFDQVLVLGAS